MQGARSESRAGARIHGEAGAGRSARGGAGGNPAATFGGTPNYSCATFGESSKALLYSYESEPLDWGLDMECTASISKGKPAEKHNTRECYDAHNCPPNVDLEMSNQNIVLADHDLAQLYEELFGKAAAEYSEKQIAKGHPERAVKDYLEKVKADKQLKPMYEFVVQVGNRENHPDVETCKRILSRWVMQFNERFGQHFALKQAVIHLDEATPHLHIEVVPVAKSTRGLAVQNSLNKAIKQAGFDDYKSMLPAWDDILTECMERDGIDRVAGSEERSRGHMTVEQYKDFKRSQELLEAQCGELAEVKDETDALVEKRDALALETAAMNERLEGLQRREKRAEKSRDGASGRVADLEKLARVCRSVGTAGPTDRRAVANSGWGAAAGRLRKTYEGIARRLAEKVQVIEKRARNLVERLWPYPPRPNPHLRPTGKEAVEEAKQDVKRLEALKGIGVRLTKRELTKLHFARQDAASSGVGRLAGGSTAAHGSARRRDSGTHAVERGRGISR